MNNAAIPESELVLHPNGRIYHLNILPEELADTVLLVGDPDRVDLISRHFDSVEVKQQLREFRVHTGYLGKKRLSVVATGIGVSNIDIVMTELDALANIDLETRQVKKNIKTLDIFRIGTCGSLCRTVDVGSVIVTDFAIGLTNLLYFYLRKEDRDEKALLKAFLKHVGKDNAMILDPVVARGSRDLIKRFVDDCHVGYTVTCVGFYGPQGRHIRAPLMYADFFDSITHFKYLDTPILNFEMETASIYGFGRILNHRCCSLSSVVVNRATQVVIDHPQEAMENLICKVLANI
ncbi:MAG: nucleoside phosphorylase [Gammaproteobacteria bacterium]